MEIHGIICCITKIVDTISNIINFSEILSKYSRSSTRLLKSCYLYFILIITNKSSGYRIGLQKVEFQYLLFIFQRFWNVEQYKCNTWTIHFKIIHYSYSGNSFLKFDITFNLIYCRHTFLISSYIISTYIPKYFNYILIIEAFHIILNTSFSKY